MLLIADEDEIFLVRKQTDDMGDDGFAIHLDQGFGYIITGAAKTFAKARHRDDDLHRGAHAVSHSSLDDNVRHPSPAIHFPVHW